MIEEALYAMLTADAAVAALVGTRVYPIPAPDQVVRPYIAYRRTGERVDRALGGPTGLVETTFELGCWAEDTTTAAGGAIARDLAAAVRAALPVGPTLIAGRLVVAAALEAQSAVYDPEADAFAELVIATLSHQEK